MAKKRAVFLDRDGTIIKQVELLHKISEVRVLPGAYDAIRELSRLGFFIVVITNQPVVARGIIMPQGVDEIHRAMMARFAKKGAKIDAVYFCPHHPNANLAEYRMKCDCRKPAIGMITQAAKDHDINLRKSFMIGDATPDVQAGNNAGLTTILVETGHGGKDPWQYENKPDFVAKNLKEAVGFIRS